MHPHYTKTSDLMTTGPKARANVRKPVVALKSQEQLDEEHADELGGVIAYGIVVTVTLCALAWLFRLELKAVLQQVAWWVTG